MSKKSSLWEKMREELIDRLRMEFDTRITYLETRVDKLYEDREIDRESARAEVAWLDQYTESLRQKSNRY